MRVARFIGEYHLLAPLYDTDEEGLRSRDAETNPLRWFVKDGRRAIGAVDAWQRPDRRLFLRFRTDDDRSYGPLTNAVANEVGGPLHASSIDGGREHHALRAVGFESEVTNDAFVIPFDLALSRLRRAWEPTGYTIQTVSDLDEDRAFDLDNRIRDLVPGTDGWLGDRAWFADEVRSAEFDPSAYLVAIEEPTDEYVGILRIWRNPDGPRLGLLGVLPGHRTPTLAAALLVKGLTAAAGWGFDSFRTETSPSNEHTRPALRRMGLVPVARSHQLVRR